MFASTNWHEVRTMTQRLFTSRDQEILTALVQKVRLFSLRQIAAHWWDGEVANARRRLKVLMGVDLLQRITVRARTLPPLQAPVAAWDPGRPAVDFGQIAHRLQSRWVHRAVRTTTAFIATPRAARLLGGTARAELKASTQVTHDLGVAHVWLVLDRSAPERADAWRGEDLMAHTRIGQKLPDAFLVDESGTPTAVIEFGGSYDAARVRDFHEDCAARALPYEIW